MKMLDVLLTNCLIFAVPDDATLSEVKTALTSYMGVLANDFYLLQNGKILSGSGKLEEHRIHVVPKVLGGKGGFGSMLRAIGAQIEKTTNREACRDLSGRRLRDINEEKRLKNWIAQQAEREKEAAERRQKKLERLCEKPKHEFRDEKYDKERSELPEKLEDAVTQGFEAASASASCKISKKRKAVDDDKGKKKKPKLWFDDDVEGDLSSDSDRSDSESKDAVSCSKSEAGDNTNCQDSESSNTSVSSVTEETKNANIEQNKESV